MSIVAVLNGLDAAALAKALSGCCASRRWVVQMSAAAPFANDEALLAAAAETWNGLAREDWLEAFAGHPKIGDLEALRSKFPDTRAWAGAEQAGVADASAAVLQRLAALNHKYQERFGYIFIVCATGKTAAEMLTLLEGRLASDPGTELLVAAGEQLKITLLRLGKLAP